MQPTGGWDRAHVSATCRVPTQGSLYGDSIRTHFGPSVGRERFKNTTGLFNGLLTDRFVTRPLTSREKDELINSFCRKRDGWRALGRRILLRMDRNMNHPFRVGLGLFRHKRARAAHGWFEGWEALQGRREFAYVANVYAGMDGSLLAYQTGTLLTRSAA